MSQEKDESRLDLYQYFLNILKVLKKLWPLILILAILFSAFSFVKAKRAFVPYYESKALFKVSFGYNPDNIISNTAVYDNTAARQLASAFPNLVNTDVMRDLIQTRIGKPYINGYIDARSFENSNLLLLTVKSNSASDAYDILCAVIDCYPQIGAYMTENPNIIISEAPSVPEAPYNSFSWHTTLIKGFVKGALIGIIIAALLSVFRKTITSPDELKRIINIPILAAFPKLPVKKRRNSENRILTAMTKTVFAESTREFKLKLLKKLKSNQKTIIITSTLSGEGKTTVSINLARTLADSGEKVVLVDCDLQKQDIGKILDSMRSTEITDSSLRKGLNDYLESSDLTISDCLSDAPKMNFKFISGKTSETRLYHADKKRLSEFFKLLSSGFDYIIIDTSPCGIVSDATLLSKYAESIIYVVKEDYASRSQIVDSINSLSSGNAELTGCVINGITGSGHKYGYGYGYKHGYGYSYGRYGYKYGYGRKYGNKETGES